MDHYQFKIYFLLVLRTLLWTFIAVFVPKKAIFPLTSSKIYFLLVLRTYLIEKCFVFKGLGTIFFIFVAETAQKVVIYQLLSS